MTIAVDSSAIVAVLKGESEVGRIVARLGVADRTLMSAASLLECGVVISSQMGASGMRQLRGLLASSEVEVVGVSPEEAEIGLEAYRRFGRGSGHVARLNFGDCFAYALAKSRNVPLLFIGDDFSRTDIVPALKQG